MSATRTDPTPVSAFPPIISIEPKLLILGSMPGVASLEAEQYYAHPRNAFWKILAIVFDQPIDSWPQKVALLMEQRLALWDVLKECRRPGSLDSNIQKDSIVCNDFAAFLRTNPGVQRIVFNGKTAERLFLKHVLPTLAELADYDYRVMPSTSPAMASLGLEEKIAIWRSALVFNPHDPDYSHA